MENEGIIYSVMLGVRCLWSPGAANIRGGDTEKPDTRARRGQSEKVFKPILFLLLTINMQKSDLPNNV